MIVVNVELSSRFNSIVGTVLDICLIVFILHYQQQRDSLGPPVTRNSICPTLLLQEQTKWKELEGSLATRRELEPISEEERSSEPPLSREAGATV